MGLSYLLITYRPDCMRRGTLKYYPNEPATHPIVLELGVPEGATLALGIPCYKYKNPLYYNYLGKNARKMLVQTIRDMFNIELWQELHTFENVLSRQDNAIFSFMEAHGIECTDTNWKALAKIYRQVAICMRPWC